MHLNISSDLNIALRKMAGETKHSLTTICDALMRLGLRATAAEIDAACAASARPMGRPLSGVPVLPPLPPPPVQSAPLLPGRTGIPQKLRESMDRAKARNAAKLKRKR